MYNSNSIDAKARLGTLEHGGMYDLEVCYIIQSRNDTENIRNYAAKAR